MKEKERLFYLDFIRAIAVVTILLTHYNAVYVYMWDETALRKVVLTYKICNLYIGDFGVSLFLIVSGAALMYVYDRNLDLKKFYKKRFVSIYPMFWIAWLGAFLHSFYLNRGIDQLVPKRNIFLTLIGMDGYLGSMIPTFYKVGDWFLGFIIIIYIVFPLLRKGIEKHPVFTAVFVSAIYCVLNIYYPFTMNKTTFLFTRLPEICFGMYFVKYIKKVNGIVAGIAGVILILNTVLQPTFDKDIQTTYIGIAAFVLLGYIGRMLAARRWFVSICRLLSKYSYAIFLTHHYIILYITSKFDLNNIRVFESYLLFILCCVVIAFFSKILYILNGKAVKLVENVNS